MFAVSQYQQIEAIEKENKNPHLVAVLFIRPNLDNADAIVSDFDYLHCRSGACCSIYAAGYTNDFTIVDNINYMKATTCNGLDWYYSAYDYDNFRSQLKNRIPKWSYSGEVELLLFQSSTSDQKAFDFRNYISLNITYGQSKEYFSTFSGFFEAIMNCTEYALEDSRRGLLTQTGKLKIREIVELALIECGHEENEVKNITKNRRFYRLSDPLRNQVAQDEDIVE